jgi:hypothetical protein
VVSTNKVCLGVLHNAPVLLQVLNLVEVGSSEVGAHASVVASDDHTASSSRGLLVISVTHSKAGLLVGLLQDVGIFVLADTAEEDN